MKYLIISSLVFLISCQKELGTPNNNASISPAYQSDEKMIGHANRAGNCENGSLHFIPTKGTQPYYYSIDGGLTWELASLPNGYHSFRNLKVGYYSTQMKDSTGSKSKIFICKLECRN